MSSTVLKVILFITILRHQSCTLIETEYDESLGNIVATPLESNSKDYPFQLRRLNNEKSRRTKKSKEPKEPKGFTKSKKVKKSKESTKSSKKSCKEYKQSKRTCETTNVKEVSFGMDMLSLVPTEVTADVYTCGEENNLNEPPPLVVYACGGGIDKGSQTLFAEKLSSKGYVVIVLEHPFSIFPGGPAMNFAQPQDFNSAITYAKTQTDFEVDSDSVALLGHSFGFTTVLDALNENCPFPFCNDAFVPLSPSVKATATFGSGLQSVQTGEFVDGYTNKGFPLYILNGAGDNLSFDTDETTGENISIGTFDRLEATKILSIVSNLDHYSIVDKIFNPDRPPHSDDVPSTLPREEQVARIVDNFDFYLQGALNGIPPADFCTCLRKEFVGIVDTCLEEYKE